jgi:hypothetical protein
MKADDVATVLGGRKAGGPWMRRLLGTSAARIGYRDKWVRR